MLTATGYRVVAFGVGRGRRAATPATVTAAIARAARAAAAGEVVVVYLACPAWSLRGSTILAVAASPRSRPPRARVRLPLAEVIAGLRQTEAATALFLDVGPAAATLDPGRVVATDAPSLARDERDGGFALLAADAAFAGGLRGPLIAALGGEAAEADGAVGFGAVAEEIQRAARAASVPGARAAPVVRLEIADLALIPAPARRALATPSPIRAVAFAPDGGRLAVGGDDGVVRRFEPRTGAAIDALPPLPAAVGGLAFDRAGRVLQIGGVDGTIAAWDLARRTSRPSRGLAVAPRELAWSDDRRRLAAPFAATTLGPGAGLAPDAIVDLSDPAVRAHLRAHLVIRHGLMVRVAGRDRELATDEHLPLVCAFAGAVLVSGGGDGRVLRWDSSFFVLASRVPRKVVTSIVSCPIITWTIWKRRPMMRERRKARRISSGVASVATSKSLGSAPISRSRTAPPTTKALWPCCCSPSQTRRLPVLMRSRVMPWIETGMTAGSWWLAVAFLPPKTREMSLRITNYRSGSAQGAAEKREFYRKVMIFQPISLLCRCSLSSGSTATGVRTLPISGRSLCESL